MSRFEYHHNTDGLTLDITLPEDERSADVLEAVVTSVEAVETLGLGRLYPNEKKPKLSIDCTPYGTRCWIADEDGKIVDEGNLSTLADFMEANLDASMNIIQV